MKKEIDRVLGNSLRCILPSYWWKRLLGKMVDKIESAEESAASAYRIAMLAGNEAATKQSKLVSGSNIKTINHQSILGSGNLDVAEEPIIFILFADTEEGKALNAKAYQQYIDDNSECPNVAINVIFGCPTVVTSRRPISNASEHQYITLIWCDFGGNIRETHIHSDGSVSSVEESHLDSELSDTSENAVQNKAIKAYVDEKVANAGGGSLSINELDITSPAQIQGIIAKVREGEHDIYWVGSDTQSSSCLSYYIYDDLSLFVVTDDLCMSIFDLQGNKIIVDTKYRIYGLAGASTSNPKRVDKNSVMYRMIADGLISGADCYLHYADNGKDYKVNQCEMTTVGSTTYLCLSAVADGIIIKLRMLNSGKYYDSTTEPLISFDSELSDTSTNAVENKVVTETLNAKADKTYVDEKVANVAGANLKTINGVSLRGEGNIELHMSEIHKKLQDIKTAVLNNEEVLAAALNDINRRLLELENLSN